jgi:hypothetical protein
MNTTSYRVGKDVLSYCSRCKLTLSHLIVSMADTVSIAKVKCNTCQSIHKYKDPSGATTKTAKKKTLSSLSSPKKTSTVIQNVWEDAVNNSHKKAKPYSPKEKFASGDVISHPTFGPGVVDSIVDNDKIKVIFKADQKTLLHNKK